MEETKPELCVQLRKIWDSSPLIDLINLSWKKWWNYLMNNYLFDILMLFFCLNSVKKYVQNTSFCPVRVHSRLSWKNLYALIQSGSSIILIHRIVLLDRSQKYGKPEYTNCEFENLFRCKTNKGEKQKLEKNRSAFHYVCRSVNRGKVKLCNRRKTKGKKCETTRYVRGMREKMRTGGAVTQMEYQFATGAAAVADKRHSFRPRLNMRFPFPFLHPSRPHPPNMALLPSSSLALSSSCADAISHCDPFFLTKKIKKETKKEMKARGREERQQKIRQRLSPVRG